MYYTGAMTVGAASAAVNHASADYYTMSSFSSWGVPGSLEMKPEITAPGGNIYSLKDGGDLSEYVRHLHGRSSDHRYGRSGGSVHP